MTLAILCLAAARAEDSTFAGTTAADTKDEPETHVTAELGGAFATGTAYYYTVNGLVSASYQKSKNKISFTGGVNLGGARAGIDADGDGVFEDVADEYTENVRKVYGDLRYDRFVTDMDSLYALVGGLHDPFAGYDWRVHEQLGYSRLLVKNETDEFKAELGGDVAEEDYVAGVAPNSATILAARVLLAEVHKFDDKGEVSDTVEVYENLIDFDDVRVLNTAALTIALSGKLSLKLSHTLSYDHVPVEGFAPLDQTSMLTLVASIL